MADKKKKNGALRGGNHSIIIGGNVSGSTIVAGNHVIVGDNNTMTNLNVLFDELHDKLEEKKDLSPKVREEIKTDLKEMQAELEKPEPDESFLARRVKNIKKMAPDIAEVAIETLKNPIAGIAELIKKVAKKASEEMA
ncbi:MAG: hypothetical protein HXY38_00440 [Chloroflexi bacterium]|nr:hypothetical protein [Chloroflexota bacterium]